MNILQDNLFQTFLSYGTSYPYILIQNMYTTSLNSLCYLESSHTQITTDYCSGRGVHMYKP